MKTIMVKLTDADARYTLMVLRDRYGKDKRTGLNKLAEIAIRQEVAQQARIELAIAEKALEGDE